MSIGPTVFKAPTIPFATLGCAAIALFFAIQAIIVSGWMTVISLVGVAIFVVAALWYWLQARRSSVLIDTNQFIINDGGHQDRYDMDEIAAVDLSAANGQIKLKDGTSVELPLEGRRLVEAAVLLTPKESN